MRSDSYMVLARKWRPAQFRDIVGQAHIVRTLTNAIKLNRLHQAYLFTGSRGIGKTSIARIFAKVIRCESAFTRNEMLECCDSCSSCKEITQGNSVDVIEIDGASNNGVEAVREIRENAKYMPASGIRKIYIIDEVHMLTSAAFNALLKTLEEPPPHVTFIFATTEPHKIPATVLSRCQRFDYKRVTLKQIQSRLEQVAQSEGIRVAPGALALISRAAEGSMRDGLSLLDQVIAFSGDEVSVQAVRESIGLIEGQTVIQVLSGIFSKNPIDAIQYVEKAHEQGHDLRSLTRGIIEFLHLIILIKINSPTLQSTEASEDEINELKAIAHLRSLEEVELFFQVFHHALELMARSPQPKILLNVLVIKCATAEALFSVDRPASTPTPTPSPQPIIPRVMPSPIEVAAAKITEPPSTTQKDKTWEGLVEHIKKSRPLLASILEHSSGTSAPLSAESGNLIIYFAPEEAYFKEQLQSRIYQEQLRTLSKDYLGFSVRFQIESSSNGESVVARRERGQKERQDLIREQALHHPIITEAKSLFGGELGPIELKEDFNAKLSS